MKDIEKHDPTSTEHGLRGRINKILLKEINRIDNALRDKFLPGDANEQKIRKKPKA